MLDSKTRNSLVATDTTSPVRWWFQDFKTGRPPEEAIEGSGGCELFLVSLSPTDSLSTLTPYAAPHCCLLHRNP
ncbi:hypothetical protein IEO21_10169 [Rhodonia placenta]|uniref:Uncharacterized protein n=1 Tax=Rhodonia placenta TaxID=104341 RepID=A0A8H7NSY6_9APHY|nr:hypothetical protein IEO21_10169 [Postia placenta]